MTALRPQASTPHLQPEPFDRPLDRPLDHIQEHHVSTTDRTYPGEQLGQPTGTEHAARLQDALFQIKRVVVGQDRLVERVVVSLLANGHCLIEGVPGPVRSPGHGSDRRRERWTDVHRRDRLTVGLDLRPDRP